MNLPSSLALPQSKFFQSRLGLLVLALVALLIVGVALFFALRAPAPPTLPTAATSPAAQTPVRPGVASKLVVYGPPAPDWVPRDPVPSAAPAAAANGAVTQAATAAPSAAATALPGQPVAPAVPVAGTPANATPVPGVASPAASAATPVATAKVEASAVTVPGVPVAGIAAGETPQSLDASVLFAREQYTYTSGGRRDPFESLIDGKYQSQSGDGSLVDVGDIHLVGIMWGSADKFALVEDSRGRGFVLRVGDPVLNGYISGITKSELQIVQNAFGESQAMAIKLQPKEGDQNATRN